MRKCHSRTLPHTFKCEVIITIKERIMFMQHFVVKILGQTDANPDTNMSGNVTSNDIPVMLLYCVPN
jgi:hypothetical protein